MEPPGEGDDVVHVNSMRGDREHGILLFGVPFNVKRDRRKGPQTALHIYHSLHWGLVLFDRCLCFFQILKDSFLGCQQPQYHFLTFCIVHALYPSASAVFFLDGLSAIQFYSTSNP